MGTGLSIYFSVTPGICWVPTPDWTLGEPTWFVHPDGPGEPEALNRTWAADLTWLWFHASIRLDLPPRG